MLQCFQGLLTSNPNFYQDLIMGLLSEKSLYVPKLTEDEENNSG